MRISNETYKKRIKAIYEICEKFAYETDDGYYIISLWELADNLNNYWFSNLFFTGKERGISFKKYFTELALEPYELHHYINRLKTTIKKIEGASLIVTPEKLNIWAKIPIPQHTEVLDDGK